MLLLDGVLLRSLPCFKDTGSQNAIASLFPLPSPVSVPEDSDGVRDMYSVSVRNSGRVAYSDGPRGAVAGLASGREVTSGISF
jgi:hypothetical protein